MHENNTPDSSARQVRVCKAPGCGLTKVACKGYCAAHYGRYRKGLSLDVPIRRRGIAPPICCVTGCDRQADGHGYCRKHRTRRKNGIPLDAPDRRANVPSRGHVCYIPNCERPAISYGLCHGHAKRVVKTGDPGTTVLEARAPRGAQLVCSVDGCERPFSAKGFCQRHYKRFRKNGAPGPVGTLIAPPGEGSIDENGYRIITVDGKRCLEHRVVMERVLGRPLLRQETVHHKFGNRTDNRPESLELWLKGHPTGQRVADLIAFVCRHYPEQVQAQLTRPPRKPRRASRPTTSQLSLIE